MKWTDHAKPIVGVNSYDHVQCKTPLGTILIEWKSWKERPSYDVMLGDMWIGVDYNIDDAKKIAEDYIRKVQKELTDFICKHDI